MTDDDDGKSIAGVIAERPCRQPVATAEKDRQRRSRAVPSKKRLRIRVPCEGARGETDNPVRRIDHPLVPDRGQQNRMLYALHVVRQNRLRMVQGRLCFTHDRPARGRSIFRRLLP